MQKKAIELYFTKQKNEKKKIQEHINCQIYQILISYLQKRK